MFKTPILFLIFNRPDTTEKVFEIIREQKPKYLYVAADGSRTDKEDEAEKCRQTREIISKIDWECEIKTLFREENLGCKVAVSSAITWFFENVEEGIILEDDCLPSNSFFNYCEVLLEKYRNDTRIFSISGNNFQEGNTRGNGSYYFSKYPHIWGWASWKRAWQFYDVNTKTYDDFKNKNQINNIFNDTKVQDFWLNHFDIIFSGKVDTWDAQFTYASISNNFLNIIPNKNLVSNIGFGVDAHHTKNSKHKFANMETEEFAEITDCSFIVYDKKADDFTFKQHYCYKELKPLNRVLRKICPIIKW